MRRRTFLGGGAALVATKGLALSGGLRGEVAAIEKEIGGRIGLAVLDMRTDSLFWWRGDARFPMCSTFKWLLAAQVLARVDAGTERLDRRLPVTAADHLDHAPFVDTRIGGTASVGELARAAVTVSDNGAANLLLAAGGGPAGLTAFCRAQGDRVTRLDRTEPTLNTALPGDSRDTTTPLASAAMLRRVLLGDALSPSGRTLLNDWMAACETGGNRLRAGLPPGWSIADKTGTGERGSVNDVGVIRRPGAAPLVVASFLTGSTLPTARLEAAQARIGRLIAAS